MQKKCKKISSLDLEEINRQSRTNGFSLDDISFEGAPLSDSLWMPNSMLPTSYLPSFQALSEKLKIKFNQMYAQAICEQFIWFEKELISPILSRYIERKQLSPDLKEALLHFIHEEDKHSELFWEVLKYSQPDFYEKNPSQFQYFHLNIHHKVFINTIITHPEQFLAWIWMSIFFEERTIEFSRKYLRESKNLDPVFCRAHHLHLLDESRHVQIDQYLLRHFYDQTPKIKKIIAVWTFQLLLRSYTSPRRISKNIIRKLATAFPMDENSLLRLKKELPLLATHPEFQEKPLAPRHYRELIFS